MIEIQWVAEDEAEAKKIGMALVKKGLVACVNIIPQILSIYEWGDRIEESEEVLCLLKAHEDAYDGIENYIVDHCSYEMPAILKVEVDGYTPYINWVCQR